MRKLNKVFMRDFIKTIHREDDGYITLALKNRQDQWKQIHHKGTAAALEGIKDTYTFTSDLYVSINSFYVPQRYSENTRKINAIYIELDNHSKTDNEITPEEVFAGLKMDLIDRELLPHPTMAINSGRGLHLYWLLDPLTKHGMAFWQAISSSMTDCIDNWLKTEGAAYNDYDVDAGVSCDPTRVMRIPGTYNTNNNKMCKFIYKHQKHVYRLDELQKKYGYAKREKQEEKQKPTPRFKSVPVNLIKCRIRDLETIQKLRQGQAIEFVARRRMCFLYRHFLLQIGHSPEYAIQETLTFNNKFKNPLSRKRLLQCTKSAETSIEREIVYKYKNTTLIDLLRVTKREMTHLSTILDELSRYRRKKRLQKQKYRGEDGLTYKQREMLDTRIEVMSYKEQGLSLTQISNLTGLNVSKVKRLSAEGTMITELIQQREILSRNMNQSGVEIAQNTGGSFFLPHMYSLFLSTANFREKAKAKYIQQYLILPDRQFKAVSIE